MVEFAIILLFVQVYFYLKVDRFIYGTFLTPTIALTIPYLIVLLTHYFFHTVLEFKSISATSIFIWNLGTFVFWVSGLLVANFFLNKRVKNPFKNIIGLDIRIKGLHKSILYITYFFIGIMFISFLKSVGKLGTKSIGSEEFAIVFAGGGLFGHSLNLLRYLLVYHIAKTSLRNHQTNIAILMIVIFNLLFLGKSWLMMPLLAGTIIRLIFIKKMNFSFRLLRIGLAIFIAGFLLFSGFYYLSLGKELPIKFVFVHFFHYLWSGLIAFSEVIKNTSFDGGMTYQLFNPIANVINKLKKMPMETQVHTLFFNTYLPYIKESNVFTFWGTILIFSGFKAYFLVSIFFSAIPHFLFVIYLARKTVFNLILYSLFLVTLLFGWFDFYFHHLFFYLIIIFTIGFNVIFTRPKGLRF